MKTFLALLLLTTAVNAQSVKGEVKKIDAEQGKITLRHDPIKSLDMGDMTMVFKADPAITKDFKVGDKILFDADRVNGQITVTKMKKQ